MSRLAVLAALVASLAAGAVPPLRADGRRLVNPAGRTVRLHGVGLLKTHSFWARSQRPELFREALACLPAAGFNAVRVPLNATLLQPAPGVFSDRPEYLATVRRHRLGSGYAICLEALLEEAERLGLYVVIELRELPCDPYRWFTGGDEERRGTGLDGGPAWMAAPAALAAGLPPLWSWLAERWRGRAVIAAFELPFTPGGPEPRLAPDAHRALAERCAAAIAAADPDRLVLLTPSGDGAAASAAERLFEAPLPAGIDGLAPRLHLGPLFAAATADDAYGLLPWVWLSWFRGFGVPVVVGAYGPAVERVGWPPAFDDGPRAGRRVLEASLAGFWQAGAAGAFLADWEPPPAGEPALTGERQAVERYAHAEPAEFEADVAVRLTADQRSADGRRDGLLAVAAVLRDLGVPRFDAIFADAAPRPGRYRAVLELEAQRSPEAVRAALSAGGVAVGAPRPPVWRFDAGREVVLYNGSGTAVSVGLEAPGDQPLGDLDSDLVEEPVNGLARLFVPAFASRHLRRLEPGETLPARAAAGTATERGLPLLLRLYDRGPVRGRWLEPWGGASTGQRKAEDGREVVLVSTDGPEQQVTLRFDPDKLVPFERWLARPSARLEILLRLTGSPPAALDVFCEGNGDRAEATAGLLPSREWQRVSVPLADLRPRGRPAFLTGVGLRLVPAGSAELGGLWLRREPEE